MASLNMAKVNTLFGKVYLLAGVIMAANMFIVNEVKAMEKKFTTEEVIKDANTEQKQNENQNASGSPVKYASLLKSGLNFILSWENTINLIGGAVFSVANNYLKWWDYNPGGYWNHRIGCLGLRSKRLLNGMLQFEGNFNLGRGFFWLLLGAYNFIKGFTVKGQQEKMFYFTPLYVSTLVAESVYRRFCNNETVAKPAHIVFFLLQGFVSIPLTLHIPKINLSISISLDSIIWGMTGMILGKKEQKPNEEDQINDIENNNKLIDSNKEGEEKIN